MSENLRRIGYASLPGIHLPLVKYQPRGRVATEDGVHLIAFDLPRFGLNNVIVLGVTPPPERVLALAAEFFSASEEGYTVRLEAGAHPALEEALRSRGWQADHDLPVLVLPHIPQPPPLPSGLTIRRVTDAALLRDYVARKSDGPPGPWDGIDALLHPTLQCALDPEIALFVGYVDGMPIAQSALYRVGDIAEIGGVATHPAYRRRAIGAALTWAAVAEGAARGCTSAALAATELGLPVYQRMGFEPAFNLRRYDTPRS